MSPESETPQLASTIHELMSFEQRIMVADMELSTMETIKSKVGDEGALAWLLTDLATFVINQADLEYASEKGHENDTLDAACARVITIAQTIWSQMVNYLKDTRDVEIHPLAMLHVLLGACKEDQSELNVAMTRAIEHQMEEMFHAASKEITTMEVPHILEIAECTDSMKLTRDFFDLMQRIGTYRRDRSAYETDEQRELHDRIIATYHRLGELNF